MLFWLPKRSPKVFQKRIPQRKRLHRSAAILATKKKPESVSEKNPTKKKASLAANFITLVDVKEACY
jgi:hypothetical protein